MANEPDISAFCPQDGDLPPTVRALSIPTPANALFQPFTTKVWWRRMSVGKMEQFR